MVSKGEGKTTSFVGANFTRAAFADRQYACRAGEIQHLADTHAWHRSSQEAGVRPFELSIGERVLRRDGRVLPLGDRALDILTYLADRPGEVREAGS